MRGILAIVFLLLLIVADYYVFKKIWSFQFDKQIVQIIVRVLGVSLIASLYLMIASFLYFRGTTFYPLSTSMVYFMGLTFALIIGKLLFVFYFGASDIIQWVMAKAQGVSFDPSKRLWVRNVGLGLVAVQFGTFFFGINQGRYNYFKRKVTLKYKNLPDAFDGFKLVQISDVHSGSFDHPEEVQKGVDLINECEADMVVLTGDLVNEYAYEADPILPYFNQIKSKQGKYACLGNHDYGTHARWNNAEEKEANFLGVQEQYKRMGFTLLNNAHIRIQKGEDQIVLAGVENWGKPPFPQTGDLDKALEGVAAEEFTILLSHDPTHWELVAKNHVKSLALTLSGHTHGMQMGIDSKWLKWSPVKYVYKYWMGLYQDKEQFLYVNRGFGFLGFPGRIGIYPEITEIILKKEA